MCFSNLPIEFDDEGNPYLAEEADEVDHASACGCGDSTEDVALDDADPEAVFDAVLETLPDDVREQLGGADRHPEGDELDRTAPAETD